MLWPIRMHGWKCGYKPQNTVISSSSFSLCSRLWRFSFNNRCCLCLCCVWVTSAKGLWNWIQQVYIYMHFCVHCLLLTAMHLLPLSACISALAISVSLHSVILTLSTYAVEVTNISPLVCEYYRFLCWCWTVRGSWHLMFTGSKQIVG